MISSSSASVAATTCSHVTTCHPAGFLAYFLDDKAEHKASNYFGYALCLLLGGGWCAASISSAGSSITEAFFAVIQFGFIGLGLMVVGTFGFHGLAAAEKEFESSEYFKEMVKKCVLVSNGTMIFIAPIGGIHDFHCADPQTVLHC